MGRYCNGSLVHWLLQWCIACSASASTCIILLPQKFQSRLHMKQGYSKACTYSAVIIITTIIIILWLLSVSLAHGQWSPVYCRFIACKAIFLGQTRHFALPSCRGVRYFGPLLESHVLASVAPHSEDWLLALPVTSCGLRLTDDAGRVAVALRLGCSVCVAHTCRYGEMVDTQGLHGLVCKQVPSRIARHQATNDVVARAISTSGTPVMKEPVGLTRLDGKRPDGLTFIP